MSDYESLIGRLTFEAGSGQGDSVCVTIEIVDDDVRESIASFVFALCEAGDEDVNIIDCYADVNIIDDDSESYCFQPILCVNGCVVMTVLLTLLVHSREEHCVYV